MKFEYVWTRQLHQQANTNAFILNNLDLYTREIIFENDRGCYCLYDLDKQKVQWERNIQHNFQHNFKQQQVYACKLTQNHYAIAGALGQIMVLNRDGEKSGHLKSERRITTPLRKIDDLLIYTSKSEIKVVRFRETME